MAAGAESVTPLLLRRSRAQAHSPPLCSEGDDCHVPSQPLPPGGAASEAPPLHESVQGLQPRQQAPRPQPGVRASAAAQRQYALEYLHRTGHLPPAPTSPGSSVAQPLTPQEAARQAAAAGAWLAQLQQQQAAAARAAAAGFELLDGWESAEDGRGGHGPHAQPLASGSLPEGGQQAQALNQASGRGAGPASPSQRRPEPSAPGQQQQPAWGQGQQAARPAPCPPPGQPPAVLQAMAGLDAGMRSAAAAPVQAQQAAQQQQQQRTRLAPLEPPQQPGSARRMAAVATPPPAALAATPGSTPPATGPASTPPGSSSQPTPEQLAREEAMLQRARALRAERRATAAEAAAGLASPQPSPPGSGPGSQPLPPDADGGPPSALTVKQRWQIQANYWQARRRQAERRLDRLQLAARATAGAPASFGGQPFETPWRQRLAPPSSPPSVHTQPALRSPGVQQAAWQAWQGQLPAGAAPTAAVAAAAGPRPQAAAAPLAPGYSTPLQGAAQQHREQQGQQQWRGHAGSAPAHHEASRLMPSPGSISPLVKRKIDFTPSPSPQAVLWAAAGAAPPPPPASFQQQAHLAAVAAGMQQPGQHASLFDLLGLGAPEPALQPSPLQQPAAWQPQQWQEQAHMEANEAEARRKRQRRMAEQQQQQQQQQLSVTGPMLQAPPPVQQQPNLMDAPTEEFQMDGDEQEDAGSAPR